MKISILVLENNFNHLSFYNSLFQILKGESIIVYTTKLIEEKILNSDIKFVVMNDNESVFKFLKKNRKNLNNSDSIIIEQPYTYFFSLIINILSLKTNKTLVIHNINTWCFPVGTAKIKILIYNIIRQIIYKFSNDIIVVSPNLKHYLDKLVLDKNIYFFPFKHPNVNFVSRSNINNEKIKIIIPGMIDTKRREYDSILDAFLVSLNNGVNNIQLILLGKLNPNKSTIIQKISDINQKYTNSIIYFTSFIPENVFNQHLELCDFLLSNLNTYYNNSKTPEIYGITKESGISALMIDYEKPCIIKGDFIPINYSYNQCIVYNTQNDLINIFSDISVKNINSHAFSKIAVENKKKIIIETNKNKNNYLNNHS
ncbi:hypothetical protein EI427_04675 [Flammeovirga pectinis]|uniref:Glycosyltransferase n=1 Tax=Flammeovirga pectinis TaxID=2494373 RepID=A0A3S9P037_9BACT|nr:hypothetical protein [Flammeovirga pectinis]AZQ61547.1 hypothetical protein EI427_04675 [Flammeovirga pectinis]